ncbi:MAG: hypothetical protein A3A94_01070 [Candidatus Portnoybacteria bacterium RIFCSPLOWO2_01_FULL_43_11]|uniref:Lipoprotein n=3 Tax=Bacteria candidate phyla TaxID=1783234 RepID=A0A1G2FI83_9BACT|nr:MAG: hypothetical protein A2713_00615 [candidate division WWE3 bacterium RIFCSPHIGHO2_01_FULL_35_17]OGZ37773.1 MAG: hypothetical protein A3E90_01030 [Candidatus Portnoybacteria bacterium RIFCSPHIGHO2_12_FULL_40_11]OGZ37829.1 MAG: hypothetical protein A3A94_01070 [Candidatus Portnoybacteria bacterium RIFCSPLOWO2_01_FULL_43_11]
MRKLVLSMVVVAVMLAARVAMAANFDAVFTDNGCAIELRVPFVGPLGGEDKEWDLKFSVVIRDPQDPNKLKLLDQIFVARFIRKEGGLLIYKYKLPFNVPFWPRYWGERRNFSCVELSDAESLYIDQSSKYSRASCNGSPGYEQVIFPDEKKIEMVRPEWNAPCRP